MVQVGNSRFVRRPVARAAKNRSKTCSLVWTGFPASMLQRKDMVVMVYVKGVILSRHHRHHHHHHHQLCFFACLLFCKARSKEGQGRQQRASKEAGPKQARKKSRRQGSKEGGKQGSKEGREEGSKEANKKGRKEGIKGRVGRKRRKGRKPARKKERKEAAWKQEKGRSSQAGWNTECPHKSVAQGPQEWVSDKCFPQECPARVFHKSAAGVSIPQECQTMFGCLFSSACLHSGLRASFIEFV